jgi:hypothetical protein
MAPLLGLGPVSQACVCVSLRNSRCHRGTGDVADHINASFKCCPFRYRIHSLEEMNRSPANICKDHRDELGTSRHAHLAPWPIQREPSSK